jgi:hypothetical protein
MKRRRHSVNVLLDKGIWLLGPIQLGIVMFQSDKIPLSEVYRHFAITMPQLYTAMGADGLPADEVSYILGLIRHRLNFMYGEAIGLSYLLDPNYLAAGMNEAHKQAAVTALRRSGSSGIVATENNVQERQKLDDGIFNEWATWFEQTLIDKESRDSTIHLLTAKRYWNINGFAYPTQPLNLWR